MKVIDPKFIPREMMIIFLKYVAQTSMSIVFNLMMNIIDFILNIHHIRIRLIGLIFHFFLLQDVYL